MIAVPASGSFLPAAAFVRSSGERFLARTKFMSGKIPSSIRFSPSTFPPKKLFNLQVRAARAESSVATLGSRAPYFELPEPLTGKVWKLDDFESYPALLVMFICNHCPFVKHLKKDIVKLTNFYIKKGLAVIAISSNSTLTHPQDGPKFMAEEAKLLNYPFPYLFDEIQPLIVRGLVKSHDGENFREDRGSGVEINREALRGKTGEKIKKKYMSQDVARAFGAVCTPEFFLYRKDGRRPLELFYHGQFDDSRPNSNIPVTGRDLSLAIDAVLSAQQLIAVQKPSVGCNIKWHPDKRV